MAKARGTPSQKLMDISDTLAPASDQLDAVELVSGPRTFTIERVSRGSAEQPVNVHLVDFPRPWRPGKSMRRVLAACWGTDASQWAGRRVTLYFDPEVTFGKERCGGTRIKALSHIDKPKRVPLLVSRGKSATFVVQPLPDDEPPAAAPDPLTSLVAALDHVGIAKDDRLDYCRNAISRDDLTKATDLTPAEIQTVIDALKADAQNGGES